MTHILTSINDLVLVRGRVKYSGLHALWMLISVINLFTNWLSFWPLAVVPHWTVSQIGLLFAFSLFQYFTASLISLKVEGGAADIAAFFERQRPMVALSYLAIGLLSLIVNYDFRAQSEVIGVSTWVTQDLLVVPMVVAALVSGFSPWRWLQWVATLFMLAASIYFLASYTLPA